MTTKYTHSKETDFRRFTPIYFQLFWADLSVRDVRVSNNFPEVNHWPFARVRKVSTVSKQ